MPEIVLTTFNARYHHSAFGLRYLLANLGELRSEAEILEFGLGDNPLEVMDRILAQNPALWVWEFTSGTWSPRPGWSRISKKSGRI
jgi:hypothetical protein